MYNNPRDGVLHPVYIAFIMAILIIWYMVMLKEFRRIEDLWIVMLNLPRPESLGHPRVEFFPDGGVRRSYEQGVFSAFYDF